MQIPLLMNPEINVKNLTLKKLLGASILKGNKFIGVSKFIETRI